MNRQQQDPGQTADDPHEHCLTCCKHKCSYRACSLVHCPQGCKARFHECKLTEHKHVCQQEKVPCINRGYGCPLEMLRKKLASHLRTCPASVVFCSMEWNRWPMHSVEKGWKAPLPYRNPHVKCGQVDVALAMRDQHVLMESFKAPLRVRRILRNPLTQRYPAVPIARTGSQPETQESPTSGSTSQTVSDDDSETPWDLNSEPPGLTQSVFNTFHRSEKAEVDRVNKSMDYMSGKQGLARLAEIAKMQEQKQRRVEEDRLSAQLSKVVQLPSNEPTKPERVEQNESDTEEDELDVYIKEKKLFEVLGVDLNMQFMSAVMPKPMKILTFQCAHEFRRDEYPWHVKNFHNDIQTNLDNWFEQRCPLAYLGCTFSFQRLRPKSPEGSIVHSSALHTLGFSNTVEASNTSSNICSGASYQEDIQTAVGRSRLREATPEIFTSVKCDSAVSVCPRYTTATSRETSPIVQDSLFASLPFEIMQKIAQHLDSFSINNLSLTCRLMQNVCSSLLDHHGIVSLVWEKSKTGPNWKVTYKKWHFSVGFTPVKDWAFQTEPGILSEHLKICPYNQEPDKNMHTTPQKVMDIIPENCLDTTDQGERMFMKKANAS